jgi:hypothetical protein
MPLQEPSDDVALIAVKPGGSVSVKTVLALFDGPLFTTVNV